MFDLAPCMQIYPNRDVHVNVLSEQRPNDLSVRLTE